MGSSNSKGSYSLDSPQAGSANSEIPVLPKEVMRHTPEPHGDVSGDGPRRTPEPEPSRWTPETAQKTPEQEPARRTPEQEPARRTPELALRLQEPAHHSTEHARISPTPEPAHHNPEPAYHSPYSADPAEVEISHDVTLLVRNEEKLLEKAIEFHTEQEKIEDEEEIMADVVQAVVCKEGDMQNGEMKEFEIEGGKIVLVKDDNKFFALGHKCTHYGAPLAKGSYSNGIVRCPWHGACFQIENGDIEDFPGLDSIASYQTKIENGHVTVIASKKLLAEGKRRKPMCKHSPSSQHGPVVIVGGGGSALSCAETLRQDNFNGRIIIVTQENDLPYDRPKLSKALDVDVETLLLRKRDFYDEHGIEVMTGKLVTEVNTESKYITLEDGTNIAYKKLVLATGGTPRTLNCPGHDLNNIFYLRRPEDGKRIAQASAGKHVVVIGSSFIGMELATWGAKKVSSTTVVGTSQLPFQQVFGEKIGAEIKKLFETNKVQFHLGSGVSEIRGHNGTVKEVVLKNGDVLPADCVIAGIGVVPSTDFIKNSGITMNDRGFIVVDKYMKTNLPDVYACGDIVVFPLSSFDHQVVNVQHWQMALKHGKIAGHNIAGKEKAITTVPFFWTVLFGKSLRYTGYGGGYDDIIIHGNVEELKFVAYFMKQNELVAVGTMNRDPIASEIAELFRNQKKIRKDMIIENPDDNWRHLLIHK